MLLRTSKGKTRIIINTGANHLLENVWPRVLITSYVNTRVSKKKFKGPLRVIKVLLNERYELEDYWEGVRKRNIYMVVATDKLQK